MNKQTTKQTKLNESENLFVFKNQNIDVETNAVYKHKNQYITAFRKLFNNKLAMLGLFIFVSLILSAGIIVCFAFDPNATFAIKQTPNSTHWFGTDAFGRDLWSRVWWSVLVSTAFALTAAAVTIVVSIVLGILSGYFKYVDMVVSAIVKVIFAIPAILLMILLTIAFGSTWTLITTATVVIVWTGPSQAIRAETKRISESDFVLASRTLNTSHTKLLFTFFMYSLPTIITQFVGLLPKLVIYEATLGFLGLTVKSAPSIGNLLGHARVFTLTDPYIMYIPLLFFAALTISLHMISYGFDEAFDKRGEF